MESKELVFTFFSLMKRDELRKIQRGWSLRASGTRPDFILRNYRLVVYRLSKGNPVGTTIANNPYSPSFDSFLYSIFNPVLNKRMPVISPPTDREVDARLEKLGDKKEDDRGGNGTRTGRAGQVEAEDGVPCFTASEFARLLVLLRYDQECREANLRLRQELTRTELDAGRSRDSFWQLISRRFNNPEVSVSFSFSGWCEEANPSNSPLCFRPASLLKDYMGKAITAFTGYKDRWERSGQNDPHNFRDFLPVLANSPDTLTAVAKRMMIYFKVSGLGTPEYDDFFTNSGTKVMNAGGLEEGIPDENARVVVDRNSDAVSAGRKRRKSESSAGGRDAMMKGVVSEFTTAMRESNSREEAISRQWMKGSERNDAVSREVQQSKDRNEIAELLESSSLKLERATERKAPAVHLAALHANYEAALASWKRCHELMSRTREAGANDE